MREIKFRGVTIDNNIMVYGDLLQYRVYPVIFDKNKLQHEVNAKTVGQYTGLKDKNGKEIYEGDIVQTNDWKWVIGFGEQECPDTDIVHWGWHLDRGDGWKNCISAKGNLLTLIGNIYENPELLGG